METKINQAIKSVLLMFGEKYFIDEIINKQKVIQDLDNYDKELMAKMLSNDIVKNNFTMTINEAIIFNVNKLIELFETNNYWQDSYTKYSKKIGLTANGRFIDESTEVVLDFPYKDTVLKAGMSKEDVSKEDAQEPFLNAIVAREEIDVLLDSKIFKNAKKYDENGSSDVSEIKDTDNLIIKGNNLLALHSLKNRYKGSVKLIYINPPYYFIKEKKEDTFAYNSNFKLSTWLTFMKNRLEIAKELLDKDGAIFVQISDDGVGELHVLLKEIFGKENFINKITLKTKSPSGFASVNPGVFETAEYILSFAKDKSKWKYNPQYVRSNYDTNYNLYISNKHEHFSKWKIENIGEYVARQQGYENKRLAIKELGRSLFDNLVADFALEHAESVFRYTTINNNASNLLVELRDKSKKEPEMVFFQTRDENYDVYVKNGQEIAFYSKKIREIDGERVPSIQLSNIWMDTPYEGIAKEGGVTLKGGKKPEKLLRRIIELATNKGDLVLDYHLGSGTTSAVAHKLERRYIGLEQLDYGENDSVARLSRVINGDKTGISKAVNWSGGGSFIYAELMEKNTGFLKEVMAAENMHELKAIFERMSQSPDIDFRVDLEEVKATLWEHSLEEQKKTLIKILDKNQLYFNYSEIDDEYVRELVSDSDYAFNQSFYKEVNQDG